jgi:hypothetical protein
MQIKVFVGSKFWIFGILIWDVTGGEGTKLRSTGWSMISDLRI